MNKLNLRINQNGFTLIEMIVVITLTAILVSAGSMIFGNIMSNYVNSQRINNLSIEAEQSIILFSKELRAAQKITSGTNAAITFVNSSGTSVSYDLSGTNFRRNLKTVNNLLSSMTIQYFDTNLAQLSMPLITDNVRLVTISLSFNQNINNMNLIQTTYLMNR